MTDPRPRVLYEQLTGVLPSGWRDSAPWGYPDQVELALVAGVFQAQVPKASADAAVDTFMRGRPHTMLDDLEGLAGVGVQGVVDALGPKWGDTNVLGVAVLRASVIHGAAAAFVSVGVRTGGDLRAAALERPAEVEKAVLAVRGLGKRTLEWVTLMAHARQRPDAELVAFVRGLVGEEAAMTPAETSELLRLTARRFASEERVLAHAVRELLADRAA